MPANQTAATRPTLADVKVCKSHCWNLGIPGFVAARTAGCSWLVCEQQVLPCSGSTQGSELRAQQDFRFFLKFLSRCWFCLWDSVWSAWSSGGGGEAFLLILATHSPWSLRPSKSTPGSPPALPELQGHQPVPASRDVQGYRQQMRGCLCKMLLCSSQSLHPLGARINHSSHLLQSPAVAGHTHSLALASDNSVGSSHS